MNYYEDYNIRYEKNIPSIELEKLFSSVNWESAKNPELLHQAFLNSSNCITMWHSNHLIGVIRSMDDGCWSANIDCLVVHSSYQHHGIGHSLVKALMNRLKNVKYINVSPDCKENVKIYTDFGFKETGGCSLQYVTS